MFDGLKNLKNLAGMLDQAGEVRERMERMRADLARREVSAEAGAGAVRVTMTGDLRVRAVELDPAMIGVLTGEGHDADREIVEELIVAATNAALERAQTLIRDEMSKATGSLGSLGGIGGGDASLPGLEGLDFSKLGELLAGGNLGDTATDRDDADDPGSTKR